MTTATASVVASARRTSTRHQRPRWQRSPAGVHFAVVALVWIGTVGLWRVSRPVLTLALAGAVYGGFQVVLSVVLGMRPHVDGIMAVVPVFEIGRSAVLGFLAGLVALAVQNLAIRR